MPFPCGKSLSLICASHGFCVMRKRHNKIKRKARNLQGLAIKVGTRLFYKRWKKQAVHCTVEEGKFSSRRGKAPLSFVWSRPLKIGSCCLLWTFARNHAYVIVLSEYKSIMRQIMVWIFLLDPVYVWNMLHFSEICLSCQCQYFPPQNKQLRLLDWKISQFTPETPWNS